MQTQEERKAYMRNYMRKYMREKYRSDPEFKKQAKERINRYRNTEVGKAYVKKYNSKPNVKKRNKKWFKDHPHYRRDWMRKRLEDPDYRKEHFERARKWKKDNAKKVKLSKRKYYLKKKKEAKIKNGKRTTTNV